MWLWKPSDLDSVYKASLNALIICHFIHLWLTDLLYWRCIHITIESNYISYLIIYKITDCNGIDYNFMLVQVRSIGKVCTCNCGQSSAIQPDLRVWRYVKAAGTKITPSSSSGYWKASHCVNTGHWIMTRYWILTTRDWPRPRALAYIQQRVVNTFLIVFRFIGCPIQQVIVVSWRDISLPWYLHAICRLAFQQASPLQSIPLSVINWSGITLFAQGFWSDTFSHYISDACCHICWFRLPSHRAECIFIVVGQKNTMMREEENDD